MVPDAGDLYWVEFGAPAGSEQAGRRPALVLSNVPYHAVSRRVVVCPVTTRARGWPTEVALPEGLRAKGVVLLDQIRAVDRRLRVIEYLDRVPPELLREVRLRLAGLLGIPLGQLT